MRRTRLLSFKYDPFGRRIYKQSSSATSVYAYDGDNLIEETNSSGTVVARYSQGLNIDEPLAMLRSATTSFYQADGLGTITSLSSGAGALAQTYTFDSFGNQIASSGSLTNPFQYTARESDPETGLYYYRARYYDTTTGRFASEDPIEFYGGTNLYLYADDDPIVLDDPFGLYSYDDFLHDASQFSAGAGDALSFGITTAVNRATGADSVVNHCSGLFSAGKWTGTAIGVAFGAAQLGRTAAYQAGEAGLGQGLRRLAFDNRSWGAVRGTWSRAAGEGEPWLKQAGQSLHHWLIPQAEKAIPQGIRNAGFNYIPISEGLNSWMNGSTVARRIVAGGMRGVILGIYGSIFRGGTNCECSE